MTKSTKETTPKNQAPESSNGPVKKYRDGALTGNIWANDSKNGTFYGFEVSRSFVGNDGKWKTVHSFRAGDLPALSRMVEQATAFIEEATL